MSVRATRTGRPRFTGVTSYTDPQGRFEFRHGPIFTDLPTDDRVDDRRERHAPKVTKVTERGAFVVTLRRCAAASPSLAQGRREAAAAASGS